MKTVHPLLALASAGILAGVALVGRAVCGSSDAAVLGIAIGTGVGAAFTAVEVVLLHRAVAAGSAGALRIQGTAAMLRVLVLFAAGLLLQETGVADGGAFALTFAGAFLASLPWLAHTVRSAAGGSARS